MGTAKKKDKLTDSEKKKLKQENKAKANPTKAAAKKEKNVAKVIRRGEADVREKEHNDAMKLYKEKEAAAQQKLDKQRQLEKEQRLEKKKRMEAEKVQLQSTATHKSEAGDDQEVPLTTTAVE